MSRQGTPTSTPDARHERPIGEADGGEASVQVVRNSTSVSWFLLPIMFTVILVVARHVRNADLAEALIGLDHSQKAEVRRAVREGTTVAQPQLAAAVGEYARCVIFHQGSELRRMRTAPGSTGSWAPCCSSSASFPALMKSARRVTS
jgi:hypothetical protein